MHIFKSLFQCVLNGRLAKNANLAVATRPTRTAVITSQENANVSRGFLEQHVIALKEMTLAMQQFQTVIPQIKVRYVSVNQNTYGKTSHAQVILLFFWYQNLFPFIVLNCFGFFRLLNRQRTYFKCQLCYMYPCCVIQLHENPERI